MKHSLRTRLLVLIVLLGVATFAACGLMTGLFFRSAEAQAGEAQAQIARACDGIAATYRFYSAQWAGPASLQGPRLKEGLTSVVQMALRDRPGVEGGIWHSQVGALAYAYPTYPGGAPKTDIPQAELSRIQAMNLAAQQDDRLSTRSVRSSSEVLLLAACPLPGPIPHVSAWTMTRVVTFAGGAYRQLMAGLAILLGTVVLATALLIRLTVTWSAHVARIEGALKGHEFVRLPVIAPTGEQELDRIIAALNLAGERLADTSERAERLARQVASSERLAAIGRVAAGVAHEIRNPIAVMRLKAENALQSEAPQQREALSMMLGQIERLSRLLTRLLSLTERDPPRRDATSVRDILEGCAAEHTDLALQKAVVIETRVDVERAVVDAEQIRRALDNLVLNAIQAAPRVSTVTLSARRENGKLRIDVHDEGEGPPAGIREHLFEPFVTGRPDGTGLGLSLVREIALAHGGDAQLLSTAAGTTFQVIIPWE